MATNNIASKRTVDNAFNPITKLDLHHFVATSLGFGFAEPVHCHKMIPDSKDVVSLKGLIRLDPMVAPTSSGMMQAKFWHKFVGMSDLFRNFGSFLTNEPVGTAGGIQKMNYLPRIKLQELSLLCLIGAKVTIYNKVTSLHTGASSFELLEDSNAINTLLNKVINVGGTNLRTQLYRSNSSGMSARVLARFSDYCSATTAMFDFGYIVGNDVWLPTGNSGAEQNSLFALKINNVVNSDAVMIDIGHCDFVFERKFDEYSGGQPTGNSFELAFAVQMSDYGKRIFKILNGLGFGVDFMSQEYVDITRLFAYYKAYFDSFGLCLYNNYESSNCNLFLRKYESGECGFNPITLVTSSTYASFFDLFVLFVHDLSACFVTEEVDYIAAHRRSDTVNQHETGWLEGIICSQAFGNDSVGQQSSTADSPVGINTTTNAVYIDTTNHTQVDADALMILYKSVNRQSVAGRRIAELLRAGGYGKYVDEMHSSFIGMSVIDIDVTDINATCDGVNSVEGVDTLFGATTGKGVGFNQEWRKDTFTFKAEEFGYWITLASVVPEGCYYQGNDQTVYDIDRFGQYNREFDSLGYELHRKSVVFSGGDWNEIYDGSRKSQSDVSFGVVPRFMRYKFAHNVVNGDFRRRSRRTQCLPFTLDKFIHANDRECIAIERNSANSADVYSMEAGIPLVNLPLAGDSWRFLNRYPWLANFERIFAAYKDFSTDWEFTKNLYANTNYWFYLMSTEDNIKLFARVNNDCYAPVKSVADSWSTTDDNDGKGQPMSQA